MVDLLTNANKFLYGSTPIGKALSEIAGGAYKSGASLRDDRSTANLARQGVSTGLNVSNIIPQSIFHTLKGSGAGQLGVNTPAGRVDAPGIGALLAGFLTPGGAAKTAPKGLRVANKVFNNMDDADLAGWVRYAQSQKIPYEILTSPSPVSYLRDSLGRYAGSRRVNG